jgi:hypothetical protein
VSEKPSYLPIRRFVTGHDAKNVAKVIMEGPATNAKHPSAGTVSTMIWSTDRTPADIAIGVTAAAPEAVHTQFSAHAECFNRRVKMKKAKLVCAAVVLAVLTIMVRTFLWESKLSANLPVPTFEGSTNALGRILFTDYLLPFEILSILLLVAMVGVILLSKKDIK